MVDPGPVGTTIANDTDFALPGLMGLQANAQAVVIDILWTDLKHLEASYSGGSAPGFILQITWSPSPNNDGSVSPSNSGFTDMNGDLIPGALSNMAGGGSLTTTTLSPAVGNFIDHGLRYALTLPTSSPLSTVQSANLNILTGDGTYLIGEWPEVPESGLAVPEPGTLVIFALGLAGLGYMRRRRAA